ncbi:MAG: ABC transporter ATP-binding protein [Pirellulaceae bacterium]|nr:ABC transporter ATP-binding protein [Pirellulaceae bacterium]
MSSVIKNNLAGTVPARVQPKRRVPADGSVVNEADQPATLKIASPYVLEARQLYKSYRKGRHVVPVLKGCDFQAISGDVTAILGHSGSGKSTLLHMLGTLDAPDQGEIYFDGGRIDNLSRPKRDLFRNTKLGMIFQFYHLLPEVSALQNVLMPMMIQQGFFNYWRNRSANKQRAIDLLTRVGLDHRLSHKPRELSGGEMQRAAIARALVIGPELLLADEPTGNLDHDTGLQILKLLLELNREQGLTIVMVTHDESIAKQCHSIIRLVGGQIKA